MAIRIIARSFSLKGKGFPAEPLESTLTLDELNMSVDCLAALLRCCGSKKWAAQMTSRRPFQDPQELFQTADEIWQNLSLDDWQEAFSHHPKIGDKESLRAKFADTKKWAEGEQSGVQQASEEVLTALADGNEVYEKKFGYIFIVCATGKSAGEMLMMLCARLKNEKEEEIRVAAAEQMQITRIRLEKLLSS